MWWYLVGAAVLYLIFKKKIQGYIAEIKKWLTANEETVEKWKSNAEIMGAYENLKFAFEDASMDRKWTVTEIIFVLGAAIYLLSLVKKFEEEE